MLLGYVRASTDEQDTAAQVSALNTASCGRIYREKASGGRWDRPELHRLLDQLRKGDVLVVWKLDRLSRSLRDVLIIMERLAEAGAGLRSLTEAIDTTTDKPGLTVNDGKLKEGEQYYLVVSVRNLTALAKFTTKK